MNVWVCVCVVQHHAHADLNAFSFSSAFSVPFRSNSLFPLFKVVYMQHASVMAKTHLHKSRKILIQAQINAHTIGNSAWQNVQRQFFYIQQLTLIFIKFMFIHYSLSRWHYNNYYCVCARYALFVWMVEYEFCGKSLSSASGDQRKSYEIITNFHLIIIIILSLTLHTVTSSPPLHLTRFDSYFQHFSHSTNEHNLRLTQFVVIFKQTTQFNYVAFFHHRFYWTL